MIQSQKSRMPAGFSRLALVALLSVSMLLAAQSDLRAQQVDTVEQGTPEQQLLVTIDTMLATIDASILNVEDRLLDLPEDAELVALLASYQGKRSEMQILRDQLSPPTPPQEATTEADTQ